MTNDNGFGFKTLLMGPYGSGKTYSLKTLLDPKIEEILGHPLKIYAIFTEPSPMNVLQDVLPKIHWTYCPPALSPWDTMVSIADKVGKMSNNALQGLAKSDPGSYNQFMEIIKLCNNFVDSEGIHHGDIEKFGTDCVFWMDSLTGINKMAKRLVAAGRPILTMPDWGVGMEMVANFMDALTCKLRCHFALCAHTEYASDDVNAPGTLKVLVSTLGRKLAPVLPVTFSDVVLTRKVGSTFSWATTDSMADLRNTYLEISNSLQPDFVQIIREWKKRTT